MRYTETQEQQARRFASMIHAAKDKIKHAHTVADLQMLYAFGLLNMQQIAALQPVCLQIYAPAHHSEIQAAFSKLYFLADAWQHIEPRLKRAALCSAYAPVSNVLARYWNSGQHETDSTFAAELCEKSLQIFREQYREERTPFIQMIDAPQTND